jgi:hypothetical protein
LHRVECDASFTRVCASAWSCGDAKPFSLPLLRALRAFVVNNPDERLIVLSRRDDHKMHGGRFLRAHRSIWSVSGRLDGLHSSQRRSLPPDAVSTTGFASRGPSWPFQRPAQTRQLCSSNPRRPQRWRPGRIDITYASARRHAGQPTAGSTPAEKAGGDKLNRAAAAKIRPAGPRLWRTTWLWADII